MPKSNKDIKSPIVPAREPGRGKTPQFYDTDLKLSGFDICHAFPSTEFMSQNGQPKGKMTQAQEDKAVIRHLLRDSFQKQATQQFIDAKAGRVAGRE